MRAHFTDHVTGHVLVERASWPEIGERSGFSGEGQSQSRGAQSDAANVM